jgi:hypothetical protein
MCRCALSPILSGRVGVSPAGDRVSRSRTWKDCFGKMPKPAGETPTLPETYLIADFTTLTLASSALPLA